MKCKSLLIGFLDEWGNFKQKNFYISKGKFFLHFTTTDPLNDWLKQNFLKGPNCQLVLAYCVLCHQIRAACGLLPNILSRSSSPK